MYRMFVTDETFQFEMLVLNLDAPENIRYMSVTRPFHLEMSELKLDAP